LQFQHFQEYILVYVKHESTVHRSNVSQMIHHAETDKKTLRFAVFI